MGIVKPNGVSHDSYVALRNAALENPVPHATPAKKKPGEPLDPTLEKQKGEESDTFQNLAGDVRLPGSRDVLESMFTLTNGGKSPIVVHRVLCWINELIVGRGVFIQDSMTRVVKSGDTYIQAGGDTDSNACLARTTNLPVGCADISLVVSYSLANYPKVSDEKNFRFVTRRETDGLHWYKKPVVASDSYCNDRVFQSPYGNVAPTSRNNDLRMRSSHNGW